MPRDSGGNYTLPAGNPVVSDTPIASTWANPTLADVADALTNSLSRNGQGGMLAPMLFADGSAGAPAITFTNEPTTGIYRPAGEVAVTIQGSKVGAFKSDGNLEVEAAAPVADADVVRKDYVDGAIQAVFDALYPVGSKKIGGDPNGIIPGTWAQLPEGTFLMNTIAGADPSGGSNDMVIPQHSHSLSGDGSHAHAVESDGSHSHPSAGNHSHQIQAFTTGSQGSNEPQLNQTVNLNATNFGNGTSTAGAHTHGAAGSHTHALSGAGDHAHTVEEAGEDPAGKNRPAYEGVEAWERTA